jgi:uncharacterized membrane protein YfcA
MEIDLGIVAAGLIVGLFVGMTGVGSGSLMAPLLILMLRLDIATAVGTALLCAAATKAASTIIHERNGANIDWYTVQRFSVGSVPAAVVTLVVLYVADVDKNELFRIMTLLLGILLIVTAICTLATPWLLSVAKSRMLRGYSDPRPTPTIVAGVLLGVLVSLSAVGGGAIGMATLLILHPKLPTGRLLATVIASGVPLALVAGLGYCVLGTVNWPILGLLLLGSIPGVALTSYVAVRTPEILVRPILSVLFAIIAIKMLA